VKDEIGVEDLFERTHHVIEAEIDVTTGVGVDPGSVRVVTDFRPFATLATRVDRSTDGQARLLRTRVTLQCLQLSCLAPREGVHSFRFPPAVVHYRQDGRQRQLVRPWGELQAVSRLGPGRPRLTEGPPAVAERFRVSPALARAVLLGVAVAAGLAGAWLVLTGLWPHAFLARRRWRRLTPLEQALAQLDAAARAGDEETRRRVLEHLAATLGEVDLAALEQESRRLAWSATPPAGDELVALGEHVRASANGGSR